MTTRTPTGRRLRLGAELRRLREEAGLTIDRVAEVLECSPSKVSRIETGQVSATPRDVRDMLGLYRVDDARLEAMVQVAREARQRGWWQKFVDVPDGVPAYVGLEAAATSIDVYMSLIVPALLQTPDYARAVIAAVRPDLPTEEVDRRVELRLRRQDLLVQQRPPPPVPPPPPPPVRGGAAARHRAAPPGGRARGHGRPAAAPAGRRRPAARPHPGPGGRRRGARRHGRAVHHLRVPGARRARRGRPGQCRRRPLPGGPGGRGPLPAGVGAAAAGGGAHSSLRSNSPPRTPPRKASHSAAVNSSTGPLPCCLESRTAIRSPTTATSTHPLVVLKVLLRHSPRACSSTARPAPSRRPGPCGRPSTADPIPSPIPHATQRERNEPTIRGQHGLNRVDPMK